MNVCFNPTCSLLVPKEENQEAETSDDDAGRNIYFSVIFSGYF